MSRRVITQSDLEKRRKTVKRTDDAEPLVVLPDEAAVAQTLKAKRLCGHCRNFDLQAGQEAMRRQRFSERMLREEKYRAEWFEHWNTYGFCKHFEGRLIPAGNAAVIMRSDIDSSSEGKTRMDKVPCPNYQDRQGGRLVMGKYAKHGLDH